MMLHGNVFSGSLFGLGASQAEVDSVVAANDAASAEHSAAVAAHLACEQKRVACQSARDEKRRREANFIAAQENYSRAALPAYTEKMLSRAKKIAQRAADLYVQGVRGSGVPTTGPTGDLAWAMPLASYHISDAARASALAACKAKFPNLRGLGMTSQEETQRLYAAGVRNPCLMAILPNAPAPALPTPPPSPDFSDLGECLEDVRCGAAPTPPLLAEVPSVDEPTFQTDSDADAPIYTIDPPVASAPSSGMSTGLLLLIGAVVVGGGALVYMQTRKKGGGS